MIWLLILGGLAGFTGLILVLLTLYRFTRIEWANWKLRRQPRLEPIKQPHRHMKIG